MQVRQRAHMPTTRCCTRREIGPVFVADEASRCAMEAADEIKVEGTEVMPTAIPDPPEIRGVEAMRTGKEKPSWSAGTVARKATRRASAGRSVPIRRGPDRLEPIGEAEYVNRFRENRFWKRFRTYRQRKSAAIALRRRIRESRKRICLCDETQSKLDEEDHPEFGRGVVRRL